MQAKIKMEMTLRFGGGTMGDLRKLAAMHESIPDDARVRLVETKTHRGSPVSDPQRIIIAWEESFDES